MTKIYDKETIQYEGEDGKMKTSTKHSFFNAEKIEIIEDEGQSYYRIIIHGKDYKQIHHLPL